ncbi:hypothetical protein FJ546_23750 [Mesorhizobium sp. B2-4-19]|nr:hypothetical protein FJ546_23750 [Mesorhizobium sp. B2-4-19]
MITNPSVFDSSQNRGVLIPVCSRSESETFRESWVISRRAEVCQQPERPALAGRFSFAEAAIAKPSKISGIG